MTQWNSLVIVPRDRATANRRYYLYRKYRQSVIDGLSPPIEDVQCVCGNYIPVAEYRVHKQSCYHSR